jgi:hypothetical protein
MPSLLLLDGSPRAERSNTLKMLAQLAEGWRQADGPAPTLLHLARPADFAAALAAFHASDVVLLGMPLYTDAMPGLVKEWIEALGPQPRQHAQQDPQPDPQTGRQTGQEPANNRAMGFLVQSGFPEARHMRPIERYLAKLAPRLGRDYAGTIVRGAGESLQSMPARAAERYFRKLHRLGSELHTDGRFSAEALQAAAGIEQLPAWSLPLLALAGRLGVINFYWKGMLKKNKAWDRRNHAPYGEACSQ